MEFRTVEYVGDNGREENITFQVLETTCPLCKKPVRFALSPDDKQFEEEAKQYRRKAEFWENRFNTLKQYTDAMVRLQQGANYD